LPLLLRAPGLAARLVGSCHPLAQPLRGGGRLLWLSLLPQGLARLGLSFVRSFLLFGLGLTTLFLPPLLHLLSVCLLVFASLVGVIHPLLLQIFDVVTAVDRV
jgi:hypothetical protein